LAGTDSFLVLSECRVDDTHVEENLGRVSNLVELAQGDVEFIVVVGPQGSDPGFDFLRRLLAHASFSSVWVVANTVEGSLPVSAT
jgi:hypothetical protein